jgi:hypothetical protein
MTVQPEDSPMEQSSKECRSSARIDIAGSTHASPDSLFKRLTETAGMLFLSAFRVPTTARSVQWGSDFSATWSRLTTPSVTMPRIQSPRWFAVTASVLAFAGLVVTDNRPLTRHTPPGSISLNSQNPDVVLDLPLLETAQKVNTHSDRAPSITISAQSQPRKDRAKQLSPEHKKVAAKVRDSVPENRTLSLATNDEAGLTLSPGEDLDWLKTPTPYSIIKTTGDLGVSWKQDPEGWWNFLGPDKFALLNPIHEGTVTFQVKRKKNGPIKFLGKEKSSWVAFFIDAKNHLLFELEAGQLVSSEILGGTKQVKSRLPIEKDSSQVTIQLSASRARLSIGNTASLETIPDKSLIGGKFGFKGHASIKDFQLLTP